MLSIKQLDLRVSGRKLAKQINLSLKPGEINILVGPNGTGKSSMLKAIFGDMKPHGGTISHQNDVLGNTLLNQWRRKFAYMPQDIKLDISLSALEVVLLGNIDALQLQLNETMITKGLQALDDVGLLHLANHQVNELSGGQCQMILFAQALLRDPEIVMLDEPVSALDLYYQQILLSHLAIKTNKENWITLVVLHDLNLAAQYADHLVVLNNGEIVAAGNPSDILTKQLVEDTYRVEADVLLDAKGLPLVRTYGHV